MNASVNFETANSLRSSILLGALTLPERAEIHRSTPQAFRPNPELAGARIGQWKHALGINEVGSLDLRLKALEIAPEDIELILGDIDPVHADEMEAPHWWSVCREVIDRACVLEPGTLPQYDFLTHDTPPDTDAATDRETPIPFEHAVAPWIEVATARLIDEHDGIENLLGPDPLRREQRGLLDNLCLIARSTLEQLHQLRKIQTYDANDLLLGMLSTGPQRSAYVATVQQVLADGWGTVMVSAPALARLMAVRVECWVRTLSEFARHLEADRIELERVFNDGKPLGRLVKGGRGVSDSHNGGRAVMVCTFECGTRIVYKPRCMAVDAAWNDILDVFNAKLDSDHQLKSLALVTGPHHGWMEFAERQGCQDEDEVRLFYRRLGCMLALIHALQGNDFHLENIVAAGPNPVAIDLETISVPRPYRDTSIMMAGKADDLVRRSVLRTLLLPSVMGMRGNHGVQNLGAIGVEIEAKGRPTIRKKLTGINTDFPRWVPMDADAPALQRNNQSQVLLEDGTAVDGNDYRSEVEHGYQIGYRSILKHRDQWLADDGPLQQLSDVWVRVLNRATNIYYQLLQETFDAARAASGVDRWVHTDRLLVNTQTVEPSDPIAQDTLNAVATSEKDAMMNGDIAYFITRGADTDYFAPDPISGEPRVIPIARLETSAMESAREQIRAMGDEDLQLQLKLMNSSYVAAQVSLDNMMHGRGIHTDGDEQNTQPKHAWSTDELDTWILRSLDCLESQAINDEESCNWIDYSHDPQTDVLQPTPLDLTIYSGLGGLALVLERAYRHFNDRRWLTLAKRCITHQFNAVTTMQTRGRFTGFDIEGPAGLMGRAGMIAACWAIGRHETHGKYRDVARRLIIDLDRRIIERDTSYDVISGSAGYMLLCMHLNRQEPIPGLDPILTALCGHLARNTSDIDGLGWLSAGPRPLCGFGHGRAGIGLALLEVGTHLNRSDYRDLGLETLRAESALKMDEHHGWPDLRSVGTGAPLPSGPQLNAWCAGAEGIASARAAALSLADDSFLEADLTYALDCVNAHQKSGRTHLCCGSAGRYEMYKSIDRVLGSAANDGKNASAMLHHSIDVEETDPTLPEHGTVGIGLFQGACGRVWSALSERMDDDASVTLLRF